MLKGCHLRLAEPPDAPAILAFQRTAIAHAPAGAYAAAALDAWWRTPVPEAAALLAAGRYLVAERAEALIGGAGWLPSDAAPATALLVGVFLHPAHQGLGLGRRLVAAAERAAAEAGCRQALVLAPSFAAGFFERLGYVPAEFAGLAPEAGLTLECRKMWKRIEPEPFAIRPPALAGALALTPARPPPN